MIRRLVAKWATYIRSGGRIYLTSRLDTSSLRKHKTTINCRLKINASKSIRRRIRERQGARQRESERGRGERDRENKGGKKREQERERGSEGEKERDAYWKNTMEDFDSIFSSRILCSAALAPNSALITERSYSPRRVTALARAREKTVY